MSPDWDDTQSEQRLRRKKTVPKGRRKIADLAAGDDGEVADATIRNLTERGYITEVVAELKSGKEATAFVARSERGSVLLKIYRDFAARSFKNDAIYREGQVIMDARAQRAMTGRSRKGLEMLQFDWVMREYAHLWELWRAGLNVPEPLAGPQVKSYAETVPAVLMRLIGHEDQPAPRLSDVRLSPEEAQSAWEQSLDGLAGILRLGYAHGDYSTYNLLWHEGQVVMIDFPQLTNRSNPHFETLLRRDVESLINSFRKHDIEAQTEATLNEVRRRARGPGPEPREVE